jgi:hypothetical protein
VRQKKQPGHLVLLHLLEIAEKHPFSPQVEVLLQMQLAARCNDEMPEEVTSEICSRLFHYCMATVPETQQVWPLSVSIFLTLQLGGMDDLRIFLEGTAYTALLCSECGGPVIFARSSRHTHRASPVPPLPLLHDTEAAEMTHEDMVEVLMNLRPEEQVQ